MRKPNQTDWGSGFTANLTVTNNGTAAITGWTVAYSYVGNQTLANGWNGSWTQSGKTVTVTNASWNGNLAAGASTRLGCATPSAQQLGPMARVTGSDTLVFVIDIVTALEPSR